MKRACLALSFLLSYSTASMADVVAKARSAKWQLSVESAGELHLPTCTLKLIAESGQVKRVTSIKRPGHACTLFGRVGIAVSDAPNREEVHVFLEAARGGDGDHTGPIVQVFHLDEQGFKKLGEQELFEASYQRSGETITSITGKVLFSLCDTCDGPEVADPEDNIFVPVRLTIGCNGICVTPSANPAERQAILQRFRERASKSDNPAAAHKQYIADLDTKLRSLLARSGQ
jgi:hypothetical protein